MDIVEVQCGSCGQAMGVSVEHLGTQVHCPHCQAVVEVPRRPGSSDPAKDKESIFSSAEESQSDLFGGGAPKPKPEMPEKRAADREVVASERQGAGGATVELSEKKPPRAAAPTPFHVEREASDADEPPASELPRPVPRRQQPSMAVPIAFMFLIPYCIATTAFIAWLLYQRQTQVLDPLERLLDTKPEDGGPRKVNKGEKYSATYQHNLKLPDKLKAGIHQSLEIGAIQVTPLKLSLNQDDNLVLSLKIRNLTEDLAFKPMSDSFLVFNRKSMNSPRPFTYLDTGAKELFDSYLEWKQGPPGREQASDGILYPGQELVLQLTTNDKHRGDVKRALEAQAQLVWRVQLRRGFVQVRGKNISATAVIGVPFSAKDVEKS